MPTGDSSVKWDSEWDAGETGCGELVLFLRKRVIALSPNQVLRLRATDGGAEEDIPAWCRSTGHRLLLADPPIYYIQRKEGD